MAQIPCIRDGNDKATISVYRLEREINEGKVGERGRQSESDRKKQNEENGGTVRGRHEQKWVTGGRKIVAFFVSATL
jgi:hypothetical protein